MQSFDTKDSEVEHADNEYVISFDRKLQSFDAKDSETKQSDIRVAESFDRKFEVTDEEALLDSVSFDTKDSNVSIPKFDNFDNNKQAVTLSNCECLGPEKSKIDGRCKPKKSEAD